MLRVYKADASTGARQSIKRVVAVLALAITENHPGVRRGERLHTHKRASDFPSEFFLQFGQ